MDTRHRSAFDIVADLRAIKKRPCLLAVLGTHNVDAVQLTSSLQANWSQIVVAIFHPVRLLTGCADVGTEKAVRLVAKSLTGELAVVFHRAEITYGKKAAEEMRDTLIAQEADALLLIAASGKKVCKHARERFGARGKRVFEIEVS